jgi:hypothetical protein
LKLLSPHDRYTYEQSSEGTWRDALDAQPTSASSSSPSTLRSDDSPAIKRVPLDQLPNDELAKLEAAVASARDDIPAAVGSGDEKRLDISVTIPGNPLLTSSAASIEAARRQPRPLPPIKQSFRVEQSSPDASAAALAKATAPNFASYSSGSWPNPSSTRTVGGSSSSKADEASRPPKRTPLKLKKIDIRGTFIVTVIEARDLPGLNADGTSDPYCTLKRKKYKAVTHITPALGDSV